MGFGVVALVILGVVTWFFRYELVSALVRVATGFFSPLDKQQQQHHLLNPDASTPSDSTAQTPPADKHIQSTPTQPVSTKNRSLSLQALLHNERSYMTVLNTLIVAYKTPLMESTTQSPPQSKKSANLCSKEFCDVIFGQVEMLRNLHQHILMELTKLIETGPNSHHSGPINEDAKIGAYFAKNVQMFKLYTSYIQKYPHAIEALANEMPSNHKFSKFIAEVDYKQAEGMGLQACLAKPLSRVQEYIVLWQEIQDNSKEGHPDYAALQSAIMDLKNIVAYNEEKCNEVLMLDKVVKIARTFNILNLIQPHRWFLHEGPLTKIRTSGSTLKCQAFLFSDLLILVTNDASHKRMSVFKKTTSKKVYSLYHDGLTIQTDDDSCSFSLQQVNGRRRTYVAENEKALSVWVDYLKGIVDPEFFNKETTRAIHQTIAETTERGDPIHRYYAQDLETLYSPDATSRWSRFEEPDNPDIIEYLDGKQEIRFATFDKLVQKLTSPSNFDFHFLFGFALTYRSFTTPVELLDRLRCRYNTPPPLNRKNSDEKLKQWKSEFLMPMRLRVVQVLKYLIDRHAYSFFDDSEFFRRLNQFIEEMSITFMGPAAGLLRAAIQRSVGNKDLMHRRFSSVVNERGSLKQHDLSKEIEAQQREYVTRHQSSGRAATESSVTMAPHPRPALPRSLSLFSQSKNLSKVAVARWPSLEIARQFTAIESLLFYKIQPQECINQAWNKQHRETKAPNIWALIQRTNKVVHWVSYNVLMCDNLKDRVHTLRKFIKTAEECRKLGNLNGVLEIVGGLNSIAVHRLKHTWEALPLHITGLFNELEALVSQEKNYKSMRRALAESSPPCIPYVGMYLTDLTFIEDGNKDTVNNKINFSKRRLLASVIREIQTYQQDVYLFQLLPELHVRLVELELPPVPSGQTIDDVLYEMSIQREEKVAARRASTPSPSSL